MLFNQFNDHCSILGTWPLQGQCSLLLHCIILVLIFMITFMQACLPNFFPCCLKMSNIFTFEWPPFAQWAKEIFMINVTFIESGNTSESIDAFYKSFAWPAKKLFEVDIFVPLLEQWSKPVSESKSLWESFAMWTLY